MIPEHSLRTLLKLRAQEADLATHALALATAEAEARESNFHERQDTERQELSSAPSLGDGVVPADMLQRWLVRSAAAAARARDDWQESLAALDIAREDCTRRKAALELLKIYAERQRAAEAAARLKKETAEIDEFVLARYGRVSRA